MGALRKFGLVAAAAAVLVPLGSCTGKPAGFKAQPAPQPAAPAQTLDLTPAADQKDLPVSTEIGISVANAGVRTVALADAKGRLIPGRLRPGGTTWVPDRPLDYKTRYSVTVTATDGRRAITKSTAFSTMAEPTRQVGTGMYLFDGQTYGVAMPVVVEFSEQIPESSRAAVESRLFVTTTPSQPGVWHWMSGRQVTYRAPEYWKPGTVLSVRAALKGLPMGDNRFGDDDRKATAKIADNRFELIVRNSNKQIDAYRNGKKVKSMPVSLGKPSTPSSSGTMVIMDKQEHTIFDTTGEPGDQYRVAIQYAQRLTWGGEFIHSAPWSVGDQGRRNVSHGCLNVAPGNAVWLFQNTHVGDPVTVKGTGVDLEKGNGFTAWDLSWKEFVKGSALPLPDELRETLVAASPAPSPAAPSPSASAPATSPTATAN